MKIVVFGASGQTGRYLVLQGLAEGYEVTAFVRNPKSLTIENPKLVVAQGDALNSVQVETAIAGKEAVLSALGFARRSPKTICADGVKNIIAAMKKCGVKRLVCQSSYGVGDTKNKGFYARYLTVIIKSRLDDKEKMEEAVKNSGLDWIIVRPTALTGNSKTGHYRAGANRKVSFWGTISRADVADFMLKQLTSDEFLHQTPTATY